MSLSILAFSLIRLAVSVTIRTLTKYISTSEYLSFLEKNVATPTKNRGVYILRARIIICRKATEVTQMNKFTNTNTDCDQCGLNPRTKELLCADCYYDVIGIAYEMDGDN